MTDEPTISPDRRPIADGRRRDLFIALALGFAAFLLLARAISFDFVNFDDHDYVSRNARVLNGLSGPGIAWAFKTLKLANWHPLTWISYMIDASLLGTKPAGFHFTNVLLHAATAAALYVTLIAMTRQRVQAMLVTALFAAHPLRMESVAWISERKDVLSGLFFVLTLLAYVRFVHRRTPGSYLAVIAFFIIALMSKPMVVTLPCVLLLLDCWPLQRNVRWPRLVLEKIPLFAIAAASSAITYFAQKWGGTVGEDYQYPLVLRICNAIVAYARYLQKTVWPSGLAVFYPYLGVMEGTALPWARVVVAAAVLLAVTVIGIVAWKRGNRAILVGWFWFLGMLVPTIGLVQVGGQSMADRYTYLPHIGLMIAVVFGVDSLIRGAPRLRQLAATFGWIVVTACAAVTFVQLRYWQNTETLFYHALAVTDHNSRAHTVLGIYYSRVHRDNDALREYKAALAIEPMNSEANNNLGNMLAAAGQKELALQHLDRAVKSQPRYAEAHNNRANVLADFGRLDEAIAAHAASVKINPESPEAQYNYGVTLARLNRAAEAQARLEKALQRRPDYPEARYAYALVMAKRGFYEAAIAQLGEAIRLRGDWPEAERQLAWLLATAPDDRYRSGERAILVAEHVNQITNYSDAAMLDALGAAYAAAGRFDNAIATATQARAVAESRKQSDLVKEIDARIQLFKSGRPYLQPTTYPTMQ